MKKNSFLIILVLGFISIMSMGCVTSMVLSEKNTNNITTGTYEDKIKSFAITTDKNNIIFISDKYNYILKSNNQLTYIMNNYQSTGFEFKPENSSFTENNDEMKIKLVFNLNYKETENNKKELGELNQLFNYGALKKLYKEHKYPIEIHLFGQRYLSNSLVNNKIELLETPITIKIKEEEIKNNYALIAKKTVLTPLAIAADGAITLGVVGVAVAASPFIFIYSLTK